jgi:hypothetical protein
MVKVLSAPPEPPAPLAGLFPPNLTLTQRVLFDAYKIRIEAMNNWDEAVKKMPGKTRFVWGDEP